ncbi:MAG: MarR family transcriptional regulator [bacterium]
MKKAAVVTRAATPLGSALEFLQHLWRVNHALERLSSRMERHLGITAQQRLVIRCIGKHPGMTAGQLARLLHLDPGTISAALRRLERRDLVVRCRAPLDKRRVALSLTATGRALTRPAAGTVEHAVERLLASARDADIDTTTALLGRLITFLTAEAA